MAIPPWTIEVLRRGLGDVARKAREPETIERLKMQAGELLQDLPQTAARGLDAVLRSAEMSKKSVQRWTRKHTALAVPMLNATGTLVTPLGSGVPIASSAVEVGVELMAGDTIGGDVTKTKLQRRLNRCLHDSDDHSIAIAHSFAAAISALATLADDRSLVIHRGHAVTMPGGQPLPSMLADALRGKSLIEVGSSNRISVNDFEGHDHFLTLLADGGDRPIELFEFGDRDAIQVAVLPISTVLPGTHPQIPSALAMISAGADCVVMSGDGVAGGPPCGIVIGRRKLVEQIQSHSRWKSLAASDAVVAMMTLTLELSSSVSTITTGHSIPIESLLSTSEENLRGRAERLATRMSGHDSIAACQVTASDARLTADGRWRFPSRQVRLRHKTQAAQTWCDHLRQDLPAVFASVDGDDLVVDLRWMSAADDSKLAEALGGHEMDSSKDPVPGATSSSSDVKHD